METDNNLIREELNKIGFILDGSVKELREIQNKVYNNKDFKSLELLFDSTVNLLTIVRNQIFSIEHIFLLNTKKI